MYEQYVDGVDNIPQIDLNCILFCRKCAFFWVLISKYNGVKVAKCVMHLISQAYSDITSTVNVNINKEDVFCCCQTGT